MAKSNLGEIDSEIEIWQEPYLAIWVAPPLATPPCSQGPPPGPSSLSATFLPPRVIVLCEHGYLSFHADLEQNNEPGESPFIS
ncbi:hypothetical protein BDA96_02G452300 [Sorghum bicolor]|uniref:Uncharacterized protein n=2 Tax=Sorghum bicolor TaxID=4558 RepID=A0A921RU26_SORBI|nr:hypothetical protein BDA96_02G452300 [Sorghum bicolor]KAG0546502.1 hypothetical protein BDA96_02G452300 [Sorghum bicolor]KAG0546503.1 hypothetical protein BDA96_02G452300 [Sorghum bicolor]KXG37051.1 hypothetical protein SORBI_3002G431500 [Sorghum bicolor]